MGKKIRTTQAARRAGVHPKTIRRWAEKGWIKVLRTPGGQLRIDEDELVAVLSSPKTEAEAR